MDDRRSLNGEVAGTVKAADPIGRAMVGDVRRSSRSAHGDIDHWHEFVEFDLVIRGSATYALDDSIYVVTPGTLIWMVPGQRHKLTRAPGLEMWVVNFKPDLLEDDWLHSLAAQPSRVLSGHELLSLDRLLSEVAQDSDEAAAYNSGITYAVMRAVRASNERPPASLKPMHPAVVRALILMRKDDHACSLSDLAKAAGIAAPYLSRLLTEQTGRSFIEWRNRIRLDRFLASYRLGDNLLNAALDAGFGSYARFHHVFGDMIGCPPSEWMTRLQDGKVVAKPGPFAPAANYGIPTTGLLSARQRWTSLTPLVSPAIKAFLGDEFAVRVVEAAPRQHGGLPAAFDQLDNAITASDVQTLMRSFGPQYLNDVADYTRLMDVHHFERIYASVLTAYMLVPARVTDLITALMGLIWSCLRSYEVTPAEVLACRPQIEGALWTLSKTIDKKLLREAHVAMQCHYVIIYQGLQATNASGDPRLKELFQDAVRGWGLEVFGRDLSLPDITPRGLELTMDVLARSRPLSVRA